MLLPLGDDLERPWFPWCTVALIFFNLAVFAGTLRNGLTHEAIRGDLTEKQVQSKIDELNSFYDIWGSVPGNLADGEVIGLLTHMFLHADLFHLIGNLIILWVFGPSLEVALGSLAFGVLYVFWGVLACIAQAATDFSSDVYLIGASGAIAGVIGGYIVMFGYAARIHMLFLLGVFPLRFRIPAIAFGVAWMFQQMFNASTDPDGTLSGVAWMAHIGGFAAGATTLLVFRNQTDRILVRHDTRLTFASRQEIHDREEQERNKTVRDTPSQASLPNLLPRPCDQCGSQLSGNHLIGDRLLKCPNPSCRRLTYLADTELTAEGDNDSAVA